MKNWQRLDQKQELLGPMRDLMRKCTFTSDQIGMVFYSNPDHSDGHVISLKDFRNIDSDDVGAWCKISGFDILPKTMPRGNRTISDNVFDTLKSGGEITIRENMSIEKVGSIITVEPTRSYECMEVVIVSRQEARYKDGGLAITLAKK